MSYGKFMRERPSAFYVSESALFIINVVSEADPVASMLRRNKDEEKFEVLNRLISRLERAISMR